MSFFNLFVICLKKDIKESLFFSIGILVLFQILNIIYFKNNFVLYPFILILISDRFCYTVISNKKELFFFKCLMNKKNLFKVSIINKFVTILIVNAFIGVLSLFITQFSFSDLLKINFFIFSFLIVGDAIFYLKLTLKITYLYIYTLYTILSLLLLILMFFIDNSTLVFLNIVMMTFTVIFSYYFKNINLNKL